MSPETAALRQRVYDQYGGCCVDCGESDYDKLTLDHVQGGGNAERRLVRQHGAAKYKRIIRLGFPKTLELRCYNCNLGKPMAATPNDQGGRTRPVPVSDDKRQVRLTLSAVTDDYLHERVTPTKPKGELVDDLLKELLALKELRAYLDSKFAEVLARLVPPVPDSVTELASDYGYRIPQLSDRNGQPLSTPIPEEPPVSSWRRRLGLR